MWKNNILNNTEQADVDYDEETNMNMDEEEPNCPFCQTFFRTKNEVEQHILIH